MPVAVAPGSLLPQPAASKATAMSATAGLAARRWHLPRKIGSCTVRPVLLVAPVHRDRAFTDPEGEPAGLFADLPVSGQRSVITDQLHLKRRSLALHIGSGVFHGAQH